MSSDPLLLSESHEWSGLWWLPGAPDERVPGVLRYDRDGGATLSLIGTFENRIMTEDSPWLTAVHEGSRTWEVMHGVAESREITLLDCVPTSTKRTMGARVDSPDRQAVRAQTVLVGVHTADEDDSLFEALQVSVENLGHWGAEKVFSGFIGAPEGARFDGSGSISAKPLESTSVTVDGTEFTLDHRRTAPSFDARRGETTGRIRDAAFVRIAPPGGCSLSSAIRSAKSIQDLISLATHRAAGVIWLRLKLTGEGPGAERHPAERYVEVLYSPAAVGERDAKAIDHHRVFFTCDDIPFEEIILRWFEVRDRLHAATDLILALRYAPAQYLESRLLMAAGAAEALHRALGIEERPMPTAEFKKMRAAMLALAPEDQRERLKSAIRNDVNLRERLNALAERPDQQAVSELVPDLDRWSRRTVKARNDLAHEGRTPDHSMEELVAVVEATTGIVILNLLHEIGLPADRQQKIVREHPRLRSIAEWAKAELVTPES
ncbi:hypothetical protein SB749_15115 [Brevibacterium sp. SIMBA_078]|uniref:ApeA N-terminal domain 1-containing protein n=1 Tax=Brevibacterium sp. SIMBA_078 TaxID=3085816 RepID=UPI00397D8479